MSVFTLFFQILTSNKASYNKESIFLRPLTAQSMCPADRTQLGHLFPNRCFMAHQLRDRWRRVMWHDSCQVATFHPSVVKKGGLAVTVYFFNIPMSSHQRITVMSNRDSKSRFFWRPAIQAQLFKVFLKWDFFTVFPFIKILFVCRKKWQETSKNKN